MRLVAMLTLWKKIYGKIILYCIFNFTEEKKELGLLAKQHQPNDRYVNQNVNPIPKIKYQSNGKLTPTTRQSPN